MPEATYQLRRLLEDAPKEHEGRLLTCIPSPWDSRDYKYSIIADATGAPPASPGPVDYRPNLPPVFDQGQRGSCVACAATWTVKAFEEMSQGDYPQGGLSAAFLYAMCKQIDGIPAQEGTFPRVAMKVLQQYGVCPEVNLPYTTLASLPAPQVPQVPDAAKAAAGKYRIQTYAQLCAPGDTDRSSLLDLIRQALQREGPILMALLVCENFQPGADGKLPLPQGRVLGGHAVGIAGDLPDQGCLIMRNSWGSGFGLDGYALLPYEWLTHRADAYGWYVFEAWTAVDWVVPQPAQKITVTPWARNMQVDSQWVTLDQPAIIINSNRMMLPVRTMAGNMGYLVSWDGSKAVLTRPN